MNVKKTIAVFMFGALAVLSAACGGGDATPTRTRVAQQEATQTPWIIIIPVTVTPGPPTATLEPTSTPSVVESSPVPPTNTRPPQPTKPPAPAATEPSVVVTQPTTPAESPTAAPPPPTPTPSCGEPYQVTTLTFPENGAKRRARPGSGAGATIQFKWEPVVGFEMDPKIGYRVSVGTPRNSAALYISHNAYLADPVAILNQQATYGLTQGDDMQATWFVDVIRTTGDFNDSGDDAQPPSGTITPCGPSSPTFSIELVVEE
ncbi:MAG: hypothetical protein IT331_18515 [Anaerolineae bacterium]|nr:hypothetical protein [Anaerolineae bacterium]